MLPPATPFPPGEPGCEPRLPPGRVLRLPGRGRTFVREVPGPPGAPTVLLLHGWMVTADLNWHTTYEALGARFRVVALDHRGHGRGLRSRRPFLLEDCADDAAALAALLGTERIVAVGYSMGGAVAQLLWRRHPGLVAGMVLCSTSRSFSDRGPTSQLYFASLLGLSVVARLTPEIVVHHLWGAAVRRCAPGALDEWALEELERKDIPAVLQAGWAIGRFRSHDWIGSVDVPTAVVATTADRVVPLPRQLGLARAIPDATVYEVEAGHSACVTHPEWFVPTLVEACAGVTGRAGAPALSG